MNDEACKRGHPWKVWGRWENYGGRLKRICAKCRSDRNNAANAAKRKV